tara:strand:+ start:1077 stop:1217 length:141 start_codon:yes stop_codon:yes gene_type:complete
VIINDIKIVNVTSVGMAFNKIDEALSIDPVVVIGNMISILEQFISY